MTAPFGRLSASSLCSTEKHTHTVPERERLLKTGQEGRDCRKTQIRTDGDLQDLDPPRIPTELSILPLNDIQKLITGFQVTTKIVRLVLLVK